MTTLHGLPAFDRLGEFGDVEADGDTVTLVAGPNTDWFNEPDGSTQVASAPALVVPVDGDVQLSATVTVDFAATFDAGVLFVHQSDSDWAKLCFERSPTGEPMAVSVVTRGVSDDCNGPVIEGNSLRLRVSRMGSVFAFHHALVGDPSDTWHMTRLFALRNPELPVRLGVLAQSPTGEGCSVTFSDIALVRRALQDPRDGH